MSLVNKVSDTLNVVLDTAIQKTATITGTATGAYMSFKEIDLFRTVVSPIIGAVIGYLTTLLCGYIYKKIKGEK
jgi:hypothetical protein